MAFSVNSELPGAFTAYRGIERMEHIILFYIQGYKGGGGSCDIIKLKVWAYTYSIIVYL